MEDEGLGEALWRGGPGFESGDERGKEDWRDEGGGEDELTERGRDLLVSL